MKIEGSYIQYGSGFNKENVSSQDVLLAIDYLVVPYQVMSLGFRV